MGLRQNVKLITTTGSANRLQLNTWLADALSQIADCPVSKLDELLPWNWAGQTRAIAA